MHQIKKAHCGYGGLDTGNDFGSFPVKEAKFLTRENASATYLKRKKKGILREEKN